MLIRAGCNTLYKIGDLPMTPTESVLQRVRDDLFATANANLPEDEKKGACTASSGVFAPSAHIASVRLHML